MCKTIYALWNKILIFFVHAAYNTKQDKYLKKIHEFFLFYFTKINATSTKT